VSKYTKEPYKTITYDQWQSLQTKTRSNAEHILRFLENVIGTPSFPKHIHKEFTFECLALFTHAVEEYGKLLYLKSLNHDSKRNVTIEYDKKNGSKGLFKDHYHKFELAEKKIRSVLTVYNGGFTTTGFTKSGFTTATKADWDARLNILNTDIDSNGNPTNITVTVDLDKLRQSVWDLRQIILQDKNKA